MNQNQTQPAQSSVPPPPTLDSATEKLANHLSAMVNALDLETRLKTFEKKQTTENLQSPSPPSISQLRWYIASFGAMGLATGLFVGLSSSPVIGTLLPLLLGLVGGAGGIYLAQANLSMPETIARAKTLGVSGILFVAFCIPASLYGMSIRNQTPLKSLLAITSPSDDEQNQGALKIPSTGEMLKLAMFRAHLKMLGATKAEQKSILTQIEQELQAKAPGATSAVSPEALLENLAQELELAVRKGASKDVITTPLASPAHSWKIENTTSSIDWTRTSTAMSVLSSELLDWARRLKNKKTVPTKFIIERLTRMLEITNEFNDRWLLRGDDARNQFWSAQFALNTTLEEFKALAAPSPLEQFFTGLQMKTDKHYPSDDSPSNRPSGFASNHPESAPSILVGGE